MSGRSSIDSLKRLSPVSDTDAAAVFGIAGREELLAAVTRLPFGRRVRAEHAPRRRRRLVLALAALALAGVATAATWAVLGSGPARETTSVECVIKGVDTIIPASSGDPAADCAAEWQREEGASAPPLVAYDNTLGGVTVLPQSETPPAGYTRLQSQDVALIELQGSLDDAVNGLNARCLDATAATALTKQRLAQFGFTGWTVAVQSGGSGSPGCYDGEYVNPASTTVNLVAIGSPQTADPTVAKLADRLRPIAQGCDSLPDAESAVRDAAQGVTYQLNATKDDSLRCTSVYLTVGGTIFVTLRGPG